MNTSTQGQTSANKLLWLGWIIMLSGLIAPIITIPTGDPQVGSLVMFLGLHSDANGLAIALGLILAPLKHIGWLIFSVPILLGLIAPIFLKVNSKLINTLLVLIYAVGFIIPVQVLLFSLKAEGLIGPGFYLWLVALLVLTISRVKSIFS